MKNLVLVLILLSPLLWGSSCSKSPTPQELAAKKDWSTALKSTWDVGHEKKETLKKSLEGYAAEMEVELGQLKGKVDERKGEAKGQLELVTEEIQGNILLLKDQIGLVERSSKEEFNQAKSKAQNAVDSIQSGFQRAWEGLTTDDVPAS